MIQNIVICLAVTTVPLFDCRDIRNAITLNTNNSTKIFTEKGIAAPLQNETTFQKNSTPIAQQNTTAGDKHNQLKTKRQVQNSYVPMTSVATADMNTKQSFYQSPLMIYPFPMLNTYYPRYFPYTYQGNHHNPLFG